MHIIVKKKILRAFFPSFNPKIPINHRRQFHCHSRPPKSRRPPLSRPAKPTKFHRKPGRSPPAKRIRRNSSTLEESGFDSIDRILLRSRIDSEATLSAATRINYLWLFPACRSFSRTVSFATNLRDLENFSKARDGCCSHPRSSAVSAVSRCYWSRRKENRRLGRWEGREKKVENDLACNSATSVQWPSMNGGPFTDSIAHERASWYIRQLNFFWLEVDRQFPTFFVRALATSSFAVSRINVNRETGRCENRRASHGNRSKSTAEQTYIHSVHCD